MGELKNLTCVCCGGRINRATMKCEYCGTEYKLNGDIPTIRIESFQNPIREYKACVLVDDYLLYKGGDSYMQYALQKLCEEMMPAVMSGMRIRTETDHITNKVRIDGSLRVVLPKEE